MAETYTSNLELVKPDYDSPADIFVINSNMDKIDNAVANAGKVQSVNGQTGAVNLSASDVGALPSDGTAVNANALNGKSADKYVLHDDALTLEEIAASTNLSGKVASAEAASQLHKKGSTIKVYTAADAVPTNTWVKAENSYYLEKGDYLLVIPFCRDQGGDDAFFERRLAYSTASEYSDDAELSSVGGNWSQAGLGSAVINVSSAATYNLFLKHYGTKAHRIDIRGYFIKL